MLIYFGTIAIIAFAMFRRPSIAAGALLCTYGLEQWAQSQNSFFFAHQLLTNALTAALVCYGIVLRFLSGKNPFAAMTREYWAGAVIYLLAFLSIGWSIDQQESWIRFGEYFKTGFIFALLMPLVIYDKDDLKATLYCLLTLGSAICTLLLVNSDWAGRMILFKQGATIGAKGMEAGNPLAIATLGGEVALAAWLMNFKGAARFWQVFRYAVIGAGFALTVKASSRGQTFAFGMAALAFLPYSRRFKSFTDFIGIAITTCLGAVIIIYVFDYITTTESKTYIPTERWEMSGFIKDFKEGRINTSIILLKLWAAEGPLRWVFGLGSSASFATELKFYCHVVLVEVLAELGIVGFILLWLTPIYAYQNLKEMWLYVRDDPEERGMIAALGAILLFEVILSFKQGSLLGSATCFGLAAILGRVVHSYRAEAARYEQLDAGGYPISDKEMQYELDESEATPAQA
jgi:hypothetical protein